MTSIRRAEPTGPTAMIPHREDDDSQRVSVDATWGTLQPMQIAEGVRTVGELEVIDHLESDRPVVDSRTADLHAERTLPGATNIPHAEAAERIGELASDVPTVLFCNGPQCGQSPLAIRSLLDAGHAPELIWYYRGGLHDWMTLGLPAVAGGDGTA
jgi:rhodanese-related sulfurtransferase